jgi:hypothetical protein
MEYIFDDSLEAYFSSKRHAHAYYFEIRRIYSRIIDDGITQVNYFTNINQNTRLSHDTRIYIHDDDMNNEFKPIHCQTCNTVREETKESRGM